MTIKRHTDIDGGYTVRRNKRRIKWPIISVWLAIGLILSASSAFAQGSIFGTVSNADLSTPANGDISFFGYLDNTDEEIRLETSTGAGYDAGNWFDDFQNYLTEAPGNPYDYHFYNIANGEGFVLSKPIPNNSFQQENITLATVSWPAAPTGLSGTPVSGSTVIITWNGSPGVTYHVYRRNATSSGSFFRIDDPTGSLSNHGVADSFFVDLLRTSPLAITNNFYEMEEVVAYGNFFDWAGVVCFLNDFDGVYFEGFFFFPYEQVEVVSDEGAHELLH